jgi:hypothetical protein
LYTAWDSYTPIRYKIGLIRCLFFRSKQLCSRVTNFNKEVKAIIEHFSTKLSYPKSALYSVLYRFSDCITCAKLPVFGPSKMKHVIKLPFISYKHSKIIVRLFKRINSVVNPHIELKFIFINNFTIGSLFPFKDRYPIQMLSHVVYELTCVTCSATYIGLTNRLLHSRVSEHRASVSGGRFSSVADHVLQTNHDIAWDDVKVKATDSVESNLPYLESLLISKLKPVLNNRQSSIKLHLF